jgi:sulfite exporter TauE/SafE
MDMAIETRAEHLAWCKQRALAYVDAGDLTNAFASMGSDLNKHPETQGHAGIELGMMLIVSGHLSTQAEMRKFIEGFN